MMSSEINVISIIDSWTISFEKSCFTRIKWLSNLQTFSPLLKLKCKVVGLQLNTSLTNALSNKKDDIFNYILFEFVLWTKKKDAFFKVIKKIFFPLCSGFFQVKIMRNMNNYCMNFCNKEISFTLGLISSSLLLSHFNHFAPPAFFRHLLIWVTLRDFQTETII